MGPWESRRLWSGGYRLTKRFKGCAVSPQAQVLLGTAACHLGLWGNPPRLTKLSSRLGSAELELGTAKEVQARRGKSQRSTGFMTGWLQAASQVESVYKALCRCPVVMSLVALPLRSLPRSLRHGAWIRDMAQERLVCEAPQASPDELTALRKVRESGFSDGGCKFLVAGGDGQAQGMPRGAGPLPVGLSTHSFFAHLGVSKEQSLNIPTSRALTIRTLKKGTRLVKKQLFGSLAQGPVQANSCLGSLRGQGGTASRSRGVAQGMRYEGITT